MALQLSLTGGEEITVREVGLFASDLLQELNDLKQFAAMKLAGTHSGIGFLGSPGWVIGASLVAGAIEAAANRSSANEGLKLLAQAVEKAAALRASVTYFAVEKIVGIAEPDPGLWSAETVLERTYELGQISRWERKEYMRRHAIPDHHQYDAIATVQHRRKYLHDGGEFLKVITNEALIAVRWSSVTRYQVVD